MHRRFVGGLFLFRLYRRWAALGWALCVQAWMPGLPARAQDAATVVARMREAAGSSILQDFKDEVLLQGKASRYESTANYALRFAPSGKFLQTLQGPLPQTVGFNGTTSWSVGESGVYRTLELLDHDLHQLWFGLQTGYWLAHLDPSAVSLAGEGSDANTLVLDIAQG